MKGPENCKQPCCKQEGTPGKCWFYNSTGIELKCASFIIVISYSIYSVEVIQTVSFYLGLATN